MASNGSVRLTEFAPFSTATNPVDFTLDDRDSAYALVRRTLEGFGYHYRLGRFGRGAHIAKVTGLSRAQLMRLIAQHRRTGDIRDRCGKPPASAYRRRYTPRDAALRVEVDEAYGRLSKPAVNDFLRDHLCPFLNFRPASSPPRPRHVRPHQEALMPTGGRHTLREA